MFSKRELEGYLEIDHRDSPGLTEAQALAARVPYLAFKAGSKFQSATITCSHCQRIVVLNPLRIRDRHYCGKCDKYICDWCEMERMQTGVCKPYSQKIAEHLEAAIKEELTNGP
jgi:hypothetical protein